MSQPQKFDGGKIRLELIPPEWTWGVGAVLTFGAQKYAAGNWATGNGFEWSRLIGATERHLTAFKSGENLDPESGLSHLYHAGCMLAFLAAHVERGRGVDDRIAIGVQRAVADMATAGVSSADATRPSVPSRSPRVRATGNGHAAPASNSRHALKG